MYDKRIAIREAIRAHWKCETHTIGERTVPCWRDGITTQCFAITENDLNFWAELHVRLLGIRSYQITYDNQIKNLTVVSIDTKPPQINLYNSIRHSRGSQDRHQQSQLMPPMGFPPMMGYPNTFMNPWFPQAMMGH